MSLLTANQLSSIRKLGELGMVTSVEIFSTTTDTGLDLTDDPYGSKLTLSTTSTTVNGWLVGRWTSERDTDAGDVDSTTTYRLRLPIGTVIEVGWDVKIGSHHYNVVDEGSDQTWPEWLTVVLRRSK